MNVNLALFVFVAGGMGSLLRWTITMWTQWPSLGVNVLGSFLIGAVYSWALANDAHPSLFTLAVMTGFLGGFTTFSAFSLELLTHMRSGDHFKALQYGVLSVGLSLLAVALGFYAIRLIWR